MESKACIPCARARRRCGKQAPYCLRYTTRGISCQYPPARPSSFVVLRDHALDSADTRPFTLGLFPPALSFSLVGDQLESWWFASPETWTIDAAPSALIPTYSRYSTLDLDRLLKTVVRWLAEWVDRGSNPFMHGQLYRCRFPSCIQDAYMALSAYLHKTASNEHMILRIIEDRVTQLVAQSAPPACSLGSATISPRAFDTLEYLARIQALLIYQCIGLYDGNIRLRHLAGQHVPVLESWLCHLVEQTRQATCCGESLVSSPDEQIVSGIGEASRTSSENLLWYSWILIESTRRTWLVACGVQGIYKLIQNGAASRLGGISFTGRNGFWEAPSALVWEKRCSEVYAGFLRITEVDKLFAMVPHEEINEFAKLVLECSYGVEQTERWGVQL